MSDKHRRILFYGIVALLIFTPLARGTVKIWSQAPFLLISYSLIFLWLKSDLKSSTDNAYSFSVSLAIALFGLLAVLSFIFSIYKHDSLLALLRLFSYIGIFYLLIKSFSGDMFRKLLGMVVIIGTVLSLYSIFQYLDFFEHSWWIPSQFPAASYVNHNHFAGYLELTIPLTLGFIFSHLAESKPKKIILTLAISIQAAAFILTQSRGGWLSLLIALLIMGVVLIKNKELKVKYFIISIILLALLFGFITFNEKEVLQRVGTMGSAVFKPQGLELSLEGRNKIWEGALGMIKDKPLLGVGIGDFDAGFYRFCPEGFAMRAVYAHNDYLQMAAEMGLLAPLLMLLIFATIISAGIRQGEHPLLLGCAIGVLSLALHGFVDFNFHIPANMLLFSVCAAYVMRLRKAGNLKNTV
ncbi:MAG: O-antigen ligase family protein [Candidatus Omnitrophota bacterium]